LAENQEEFVQMIVSLIGKPEVMQRMRTKAKDDAFARFSLERMVERYETLYRQLGK
jgi:glycosyltransferase involved in cell wall biosynthesis